MAIAIANWVRNAPQEPTITKVKQGDQVMIGEEKEIGGFIDAKLSGLRIKKRSITSWKVWRRHWCTVKKLGPSLGIEIQLNRGLSNDGVNERKYFINVPSNSIICRTESKTKLFAFGIFLAKEKKPLLYLNTISETESQRWIANLRQLLRPRKYQLIDGAYNISLIDNNHSRAAGLSGLYGDLIASQSGVFIKDFHNGEIIQVLNWNEMNQFHLATSGRPEDVKRICVIHTTNEFRNGIGEINIFCINSKKLLHDLVRQGRGTKNKYQSIRPLSFSEGDLRLSIHYEELQENNFNIQSKNKFSFIYPLKFGSETKIFNKIKSDSNDTLENINLTVSNVYQTVPANNSITNLTDIDKDEKLLPKRISNISITSGIYDEIKFNIPISISTNFYENSQELMNYNSSNEIRVSRSNIPPPLPPRSNCDFKFIQNNDESNKNINAENSSQLITTKDTKNLISPLDKIKLESEYVPMSPILKKVVNLEQTDSVYVIMR